MADNYPKDTWKKKTVSETLEMYAEWASTYDEDVAQSGYATPRRIAEALFAHLKDPCARVLDFGCGTGLSGLALKGAGFSRIDGVDISGEMLAKARARGCYGTLMQVAPGDFSFLRSGHYKAVVAAGVISLGAAPAGYLRALLENLAVGGDLVFSYNDPTLLDDEYMQALDEVLSSRLAEQLFREKGAHLPGKGIGSDIFILRRL